MPKKSGAAQNLGGLVQRHADPDKPAFVFVDFSESTAGSATTYSHGEIDKLADAVARGLVRWGLRRGQAVALLAENSVRYFVTYLGIMRAGLIAVPINYRQPGPVIEHILQDSAAKLVFADQARDHLLPGHIVHLALDTQSPDAYEDFLDPGDFDPVVPDADETAMLLYTSGSTGMPKGVMLSHRGQLHALSRWDSQREDLTRQRLLIAAPLYHMNALFVSKMALYMHATAILLPRFSPEHYLRAIAEHRATWVTSVPTMLALALRHPDVLAEIDKSSVERVSMGSAPLTEALFDAVQNWFPDAMVTNFYGTTEHGPSAFGPHPDGLPRPKLSIGYPAPGMELRLAGGPSEDHGVLEVRSPSNLTGYKNLPGKTTDCLTDDNWYHTKDVMTRDENGFYFIVGREDDMFVCNGENVFPGDVERLLETHPDVAQASVVPLADPIRGHMPVAFVVPEPGASVTEDELQHHARSNGPAYQFPRQVHFLEDLPLAGTNKIDRAALTKQAEILAHDTERA